MKTTRIRRLYTGTFTVLVFYVLLLLFMAVSIPNGRTLWADKQWADGQIRGAKTLEELQGIAHFAASSISSSQECWGVLLTIFMFVTIVMIVFQGWSLFTTGRLKRGDSIDHAA